MIAATLPERHTCGLDIFFFLESTDNGATLVRRGDAWTLRSHDSLRATLNGELIGILDSKTVVARVPLLIGGAMPSIRHEALLLMVRDQPELVATMLTDLLHVELPRFTSARLADTTLQEPVPVEYRADSVVLFVDEEPVFGAIVEVQLQRDADKLFTWPQYAVAARAQHRCPFIVIVVTPDRETMEWAARPIDLGGGNLFRVHVLGPDKIPLVMDPAAATRNVQLAVLSVIAHGRGDPQTAIAIAKAAATGIEQLSEESRVLYAIFIKASLGEAARKAFEMRPEEMDGSEFAKLFQKMLDARKAREDDLARGMAAGKAQAVLQILEARAIAVTDTQRACIVGCSDLETLERWIRGAVTAATTEELIGVA